MNGRIHFPGNPWPNGHAVETFAWTARLVPERGLVFDLHLVSASYYAEDTPSEEDVEDDEDEGDWPSRIVWRNYHRCSLSSTKWSDDGFVVGTRDAPFDAALLAHHTFVVDPLAPGETADDRELDDAPIGVYLLGHDSVADHRITFMRRDDGLYDLAWTGRIALTYAGGTEYKYTFTAQIPGIALPAVTWPKALSRADAEAELARVSRGFRLVDRSGS